MTKTIEARFTRAQLPSWARRYPAVVKRCEKDLAFRCSVMVASTEDYKKFLIKQAERLERRDSE